MISLKIGDGILVSIHEDRFKIDNIQLPLTEENALRYLFPYLKYEVSPYLFLFCGLGYLSIVKAYIDIGVDLLEKGQELLIVSASNNHKHILEYLIENCKVPLVGHTLIIIEDKNPNEDIIEYLNGLQTITFFEMYNDVEGK